MTPSLHKTFHEIGLIFNDLSRLSEKKWRNDKTLGDQKVPPETREIYDNLQYSKKQTRKEEIEKIFKDDDNKDDDHKHDIAFNNLYLPPLDSNIEFVPILSMVCDLKKDCHISLRVEMRGYDNNKKSIGLGFRFESPHPGGIHDYWHIQLITENGEKLGCPEWLPEKNPCFPVKVKKPIDLIFFMLLCFYGKSGSIIFGNSPDINSQYDSYSFEYFS